nr:hypothetical protein [Tanacetum cinerariifolium]
MDQVGERVIKGPEMIEVTNEKVIVAKEKLKEARTRQKSYADKHRRSIEFPPGDRVFLKVSPARGVRRFGYKYYPLHVISYLLDQIRVDLSYIEEPEAILDRQDRVMRTRLFILSRFFGGTIPSGKPLGKLRSLSGLLILIFFHDLAILDRQDRVMKKKTIPFVKILWRNHPDREATWETEESIRTSYPHFLS